MGWVNNEKESLGKKNEHRHIDVSNAMLHSFSQTLHFSNLLITRTKKSFPLDLSFTIILPPNSGTPGFENQFSFPLEGREIVIPL